MCARACVCVCVCVCVSHSVMSNSVTLWIVAHQAPLPMGFSRQEYWSELPCPSPGPLVLNRVKKERDLAGIQPPGPALKINSAKCSAFQALFSPSLLAATSPACRGGSHQPPSLPTLLPLPLTRQNSSEPSLIKGLRCPEESNTAPTTKEVNVKGFSGYNAT